jgi:hypothetical protein
MADYILSDIICYLFPDDVSMWIEKYNTECDIII